MAWIYNIVDAVCRDNQLSSTKRNVALDKLHYQSLQSVNNQGIHKFINYAFILVWFIFRLGFFVILGEVIQMDFINIKIFRY